MYDWETRLTSVDNNRVVRPLDWGLDWTQGWPGRNGGPRNGCQNPRDLLEYFSRFNDRIIRDSDSFYSYQKPADFRLERREVQVFSTREVPDPRLEEKVRGTQAEFLRFTSPVVTPFPENNLVNARWFPARGRRAVVFLPHWNSDAISYTSLCRVLNWMGIAVLRLSMPYHDIRRPAEIDRADYAVSANIGRTLDSVRQGVIDVRCCLDWLEAQGYNRLGHRGHEPGIVLRVYRYRARSADSGGCVQSRLDLFCRRGVARAVHAAHPRRPRSGYRSGESAAGVARRQSHGVLRQVFALAAPLAHYLCEVRHDVPAGIFRASGRRIQEAQIGSQSRRAALRALHDGGNAIQIHGWLAAG
jgi:hypothetical protein